LLPEDEIERGFTFAFVFDVFDVFEVFEVT
jgi:hypothetical protein